MIWIVRRLSLNKALWLALLPVFLGSHPLLAQNTAFTYQGRLTLNGTNITGTFDFTFSLYDSQTNGNQVGSTITNDLTPVASSRFTVPLDFGYGVFDGSQLWLELGVRPTGSNADFTVLAPRQALTATPYALFALSSDASGLTGTVPDSSLSSNVVRFNQGGYNAAVVLNNPSNQFTGVFSGDGGGLTNLAIATTNLNLYNSAADPGFLTMNPVLVLDPNYAAPLYIGQGQVPQLYTTDPHPDTINKLIAYNETGIGSVVNPQEPAFSMTFESDWANYSQSLQSEFYFEYTFPYTNYNIRPFGFNFVRSTNTSPDSVNLQVSGGVTADSFALGNFDNTSPNQVVFNMTRGAYAPAAMGITGTIYTHSNSANLGGIDISDAGTLVIHDQNNFASMYIGAWEGQFLNHNPGFLVNNTNVTPYFYGQKTLRIYGGNDQAPAFEIRAADAGQTGDLLQLNDSTGNVLANVKANGNARFNAVCAPGGFFGSGAGLTNLNWNNIANPPVFPSTNGLASYGDVTNIASAQAQLAVASLATNLNGGYLQPGTVNSNALDPATLQLLGGPANVRNGMASIADSATVVTVVFSSPLPDTNYSVVATPEFNTGGVTWWVDTKTASSFNFNLAAGVAGGGNVSWEAKSSQ